MRTMPLRTAAVALITTCALSSSAWAQVNPDPAPAPPPPEPAEQAQPQPEPTPSPGPTPVDVPTPAQGEPDKVTSEPEVTGGRPGAPGDKRRPGAAWVRWRGSALNWSHDVTTTAVGIGRDNIGSENEVYSQGFGGTLNFFVIDEKDFRLRMTTALGFDVELTDSGSTTTRNEPRFRDVPLTIATGGLTLAHSDNDEWAFGFIPNFTTIFPTSPISQDQGVYLTVSPRLLTFLAAPILGNEAAHLKGIFAGVSVRYDRTFSRANVPTNPALERPRTDPSGNVFFSDQISGNRLGENMVRVGGFVFLEEKFGPSTLWLFAGPSWTVSFLPEFSDADCVETATGCVDVGNDPNAPNTRITTGFGGGVSFFPSAEFGFGLNYSNNALQLGEDGQRRDIFYSPDATFNAELIVSVDAIYERIVGDPRKDPVIIFGKNAPAPNPTPGTQQLPPAMATF